MDRIVILVIAISLIGCVEKHSTNPWGSLPSMGTHDKGACKGKTYPDRIPGSAIDYGELLYPPDKQGANISHQIYLGETCFEASIMMSEYEAPEDQVYNHYTIEVTVPHLDSRCAIGSELDICKQNPIAYTVIFQRELRPEDVGQHFRNKRMEDVVTFDEKTKVVRFNAGSKTYEYQLPNL